MPLSNYARQKLGENILGVASYTVPSLYFELGTTYSGYARQPLAVNAPSGGFATLSADLLFPTPASDVGGPLGTIDVYDAASGGNLYIDRASILTNIVTGRAGLGADWRPTIDDTWLRFAISQSDGGNATVKDAILSYALGFGDYSPVVEFGIVFNFGGDYTTYTESSWDDPGGIGAPYARSPATGLFESYTTGGILRQRNTTLHEWHVGSGVGAGYTLRRAALFLDGELAQVFGTSLSGVGGDFLQIQPHDFEFFVSASNAD